MQPIINTPKKRMLAFLTGQPLDRLPVIPLILNQAARVANIPVGEQVRDGAKMGAAHVAAWRRYGQDMITVFTDTAVVAEAMGTTLHYSPDDAARVETPLVLAESDLSKIVIPSPLDDTGIKVYVDAVKHCVAEVGEEVFVGCCIPAPFTTAACLHGTDKLARDLHRNPDFAQELIQLSLQATLPFIEAVAEAGGVPAIVDPVATGSVLSEKLFRTFALPGLQAMVDKIHAFKLPALVHVCGKTTRLLEALADTGADILSLDVVDLEEVKNRIGDRVTLMGNVRGSQTLLEGSPEQIEAEVISCLRKAGDSPRGYIIATGCEVPLNTPSENVEIMIAAAHRWGRLPLELPNESM